MRDTGFLAKRKASLGEYSGTDESVASAAGATSPIKIRSKATISYLPFLLLNNGVAPRLLIKEIPELLNLALDLFSAWSREIFTTHHFPHFRGMQIAHCFTPLVFAGA